MVLQVEDFSENTLTVEDYDAQPSQAIPVNKRSASQLAAGQTVLSTGSREEYEESKNELLDPERKSQFIVKQDNIRQKLFEDAKVGLVDIISNPNTPQEQKEMAFSGAAADLSPTVMTSSLDLLAEEAAIADSGPDEDARTAESRNLLLESAKKSNKHKRDMALLVNGLSPDPNVLGTIKDSAELMAPWAEWIHFDRLLKDLKGESDTGLLGKQKQQVFDYLKGRPLEERAEMAQSLADLITNSDTIVLPDGNDLATIETLQNMLVTNEYADWERYFDNVTSVLDIVGVGALLRTTVKTGKIANTTRRMNEELMDLAAGKVERQAKTHAVRTDVVPTAPSQIVKDVNPELARQMHKEVLADETDEAAQALYGTTKDEVIAKDTLHEPQIEGANMPNKVEMGPVDEPEHIKKNRRRSGNTILSDEEKASLRTKISNSLDNVSGMVLHPSSLQIRLNPNDTVGFTARYSPMDSGFESPADAIEAAEVAFRNYGLTSDNFTILARRGDEWVEAPVKDLHAEMELKAAGATGEELDAVDYAVGMKFDYTVRPEDLDLISAELENLTTATGLVSSIVQKLDRIDNPFFASSGQGSIVQNLLDAASVIHARIVNSASVAVDRALGIKKLYVDEFEKFNKGYGKLDKARRAAMTDYINDANLNGIALDIADLYSKGFSKKEVELLKDWRRANDIMWHAANEDMVQSLRAKGVRVFTHDDSDTTLMGRPIKSPKAAHGVAYDAVTGATVKKTSEELDKLYEMGGEVMELLEPIEVDGRWVSKVITPNTPSGGFNRVLRNNEKVLAYREGYYPVMYDANKFVYKNYKDADGNQRQKVFAATQSSKDADRILEAIQKRDKLSDDEMKAMYGQRKDNRFEVATNSLFDEGAWNVSANSGLTSQRLRGKRLIGDEANNLQGLGKEHLKDPLAAVATQIQHLSQRVAMRNYLDMVKKRWMIQYADDLDLPINPKTGKVETPKSIREIRGKDGVSKKIVGDARSNYNYISSLENGYINQMDKAYRASLLAIADSLGSFGFSLGEKAAFGAAKRSPTQFAKTAAFKMFISANPLRQALIQRGQILMLAAHNPEYALKHAVKDLVQLRLAQKGVKTDKKYVDLWNEVKDAGIIEAVDAHTLIRDDLLHMADFSAIKTVGDTLATPLNYLQKVGFDWAEQDVLLSAWLSARDKAEKAGKNLKLQSVKDEILGEARAFTLNMNRAGEMPYSQNSLAAATQFLSFQHKALIQGFTNRNLSVKQKATLVGYSLAMFGMDASILTFTTDAIFGKEPSEVKDKVKNGLLDTTLNWALTQLSGEAQAIDFGDFAPSEAYGLGNTFVSLLNTSIPEILLDSPSGSLLFGANPRVTDAFATGFKYFVPSSDYNDPELEVKYSDVLHTSMNLFSGYSNSFKANYAFKYGKKMSGTGRITDDDVTKIEAIATTFGFRTKEEEGARLIAEEKFGNQDYNPDDVQKWYQEMKRHLARRYDSVREFDLAQRVLNEAWEVFGDDRENVIETMSRMIEKDAEEGNFKFISGIIKQMGNTTDDELWETINLLPAGPQRDALVDIMKHREDDTNGS